MDRYVIKEPRVGEGFPQGNQMMAFPANARSGNMVSSENLYYSGGHTSNLRNVQQTVNINSPHLGQTQLQNMNSPHLGQTQPQNMNMSHMGHTHMGQDEPQNMYSPHMGMGLTQTFATSPAMVNQCHMSGIDPRYLAGYGDTSTQYIIAGQPIQRNQTPIYTFGNDYQNRSFEAVDRNVKKPKNTQQALSKPQTEVMTLGGLEPAKFEELPKPQSYTTPEVKNTQNQNQKNSQCKVPSSKKPYELDLTRNDGQIQMMTRADKLKALQKSGPRAFSGPVEKVLKWHKTLQDVGILIIYEIVAKCVSVRPGEQCAKNLVVRDDSGPAIQVVYYEIDFLLPELKPPCTVRIVGRMMAGTCRFQAFNVRPATGDDVATLPRRAAVAAHHVAKLCKEYGHNGQQL